MEGRHPGIIKILHQVGLGAMNIAWGVRDVTRNIGEDGDGQRWMFYSASVMSNDGMIYPEQDYGFSKWEGKVPGEA